MYTLSKFSALYIPLLDIGLVTLLRHVASIVLYPSRLARDIVTKHPELCVAGSSYRYLNQQPLNWEPIILPPDYRRRRNLNNRQNPN